MAHLGGQQSNLLGYILQGTTGFFQFLNLYATVSNLKLNDRDNVKQTLTFQKLRKVYSLHNFTIIKFT